MGARTFDAAFREAFRLAWFLHGERTTARAIATEAFAQVKVAVAAQRKRFYYRPRGERSKVELSELQLLQRLVLIASEPYERAGEAAGRTTQADLVLRFVKHLVRITMKRNSFHVALGLTRVLHDYPAPAAMDLYGLLLADPGKNPDDPYYRSRKRLLLAELAERFGPLVELVRGPGGEDRFASQPSDRFAGLVRQALGRFAPWGGEKAADADLRRIFAVLHPPSFDRLLATLRLPRSAERLTLPVFHLDEEAAPPDDRSDPPDPTCEELAAAQAELARRAQARRQPAPAWLAVRVDGAVQGRVGLDGEPCVVQLPEGAERIEITGGGSELLALLLLKGSRLEDAGAVERWVVELAAGQRLELALDPPLLRVTYAQRAPVWRQAVERLASGRFWASPVLTVAVLLLVIALPVLVRQRLSQTDRTDQTERTDPAEITRGPLAEPDRPGNHAGVILWLEPAPAAVDPALAAALSRGLQRHAGLAVSRDREAADLALRWLPGPGGGASLALVTRGGDVLWQARPAAGSPERQAAAWLRELAPYLHSPSRTNPDQ
ncbi:MAG TPA: hypothetical protein VEW48_07305 [Thermoanaerobaculia bacterium]|nr:hypothetical protein [Thermoanaerobaculia bacterium]